MDESTRPSLPEPDSVSPVPESVSAGGEEDPSLDVSHLPPEHQEVVERLHRRVEQAAATIERLRAENERLRRRVEELEAQPAFPDDETVLALSEDPDDLKQRITRFIDAIDTYLGETEASNDDPTAQEADDPASS